VRSALLAHQASLGIGIELNGQKISGKAVIFSLLLASPS
jgi:hypothetical protein